MRRLDLDALDGSLVLGEEAGQSVAHLDGLVPSDDDLFDDDGVVAMEMPAPRASALPQQDQAREAVRPVPDPIHGADILHPAPVPRFPGENPDTIAWPGPSIGQHTDEVLAEVLGMGGDAIADLRANGTI